MKPLLYLTWRSLVNSVRRALRSPTRLIGVAFLLLWWFSIVGANFFRGPTRTQGLPTPPPLPDSIFPIFHLLLLGGFLTLLAMRLSMAFRVPGYYQGADADVLFPTPISPRIVLLHRFVFDYLFTLLFPLLLLVFGGRQSWRGLEYLARGVEDPAQAGRMALAAYLLVTLFGVSLSYALGLWINRDSPEGRQGRRIVLALLLALAAYLAGGVVGAIRSGQAVDALLAFSNAPISRVVLLPVHAGANMVLGFLHGPATIAWSGLAILVLGSLSFLGLALRQADHLYDMAAKQIGGVQARREAHRQGDMFSIYRLYAQQGRLKARKPPLIYKMNLRGPYAILWREAILQFRAYTGMFVIMLLILGFMSAIAILAPDDESGAASRVQMTMHGLIILSFAMSAAQGGFLEMLRRVDVEKPLPFPVRTICLMEILGKCLFPALLGTISALLIFGTTLDWDTALAVLFAFPTTAAAIVAVQMILILNFPDVDDPTQRGFRGLLQFLGAAIASLPTLILFVVFGLLGLPLALAGILAAACGAALVFLCSQLAVPFYANYNPAD
ncbi:MAG: hypothetical protein D6724_05040 [Armatimonadetes bacterium]|nr:MAG: hypothetical protein D6724_05040 [Armatimonadota bacterium]